MKLVEIAEDILSKANAYTNNTGLTSSQRFQLREEIRYQANGILSAIDGPEQTMKAIARSYTTCTALKVCVDLKLASHLPLSDARSLSQLAQICGCDSRVLRPMLRLLAKNGIFEQVDAETWQHTELSAVMAQPPFQALEEKYRSVAHLPRLLQAVSHQFPTPGRTAFNQVYCTSLDFYTYSNELDHAAARNFAFSMKELARNQIPFVQQSYPLETIDPESHFIDVAGGVGYLSFFLAGSFPKATFEVQDHPFIIEEAHSVCPSELRDRITFRAHNILHPQPEIAKEINGRLVFLVKIILHDHGDDDCRLMLRNLVSVMKQGDRILIIDTVIPETGGSLSSANSDIIIMSMFGSGHRTLEEFRALIHHCGEDLVIETFASGDEEYDGMMVIEVRKAEPVLDN
ncbi:Sat18 [Stachybotrys chartarum IBT 40293]|nr:Sat18 [Stachybotrys chartarum IBT 40293]